MYGISGANSSDGIRNRLPSLTALNWPQTVCRLRWAPGQDALLLLGSVVVWPAWKHQLATRTLLLLLLYTERDHWSLGVGLLGNSDRRQPFPSSAWVTRDSKRCVLPGRQQARAVNPIDPMAAHFMTRNAGSPRFSLSIGSIIHTV